MWATSLRELCDEAAFGIWRPEMRKHLNISHKRHFKKTLRHSASPSDHKETLFKYPVQWFMLTCRVLGWSGLGRTFPFLSFPPSPLFLSVCVRAEETLRGAEWPPSLVRMKNRSAARQNQSWHTTLHDTDAQAVLFFLSRPGPILFLLELIIDHFTDEHVYVPNTGTVFYNVGKCFSRIFFFF